MAKKSRSARKASLERATRAIARGLPTAAPPAEKRPVAGPYAVRRRGTPSSSKDDSYTNKGMPTVAKVALGALFALSLVFLLSQLRK